MKLDPDAVRRRYETLMISRGPYATALAPDNTMISRHDTQIIVEALCAEFNEQFEKALEDASTDLLERAGLHLIQLADRRLQETRDALAGMAPQLPKRYYPHPMCCANCSRVAVFHCATAQPTCASHKSSCCTPIPCPGCGHTDPLEDAHTDDRCPMSGIPREDWFTQFPDEQDA